MGFALIGSAGDKKSTSSTTNQTYNYQRTATQAADNGAQSIISHGGSVEVLDEGAIQMSFDFGEHAFDALAQALTGAQAQVQRATESVRDATMSAVSQIGTAYQTANQTPEPLNVNTAIKWGFAGLAIFAVMKYGKGLF